MTAPDARDGLLAAVRREGLDTLAGAFAYGAGQDLAKPGLGGRRRTRLTLADDAGRPHVLYLKRYEGGVWAALRRWWTYGRRCSAAGVEFDNVRKARAAGVPTMRAVCWAEGPCPLRAERSCLIVTGVPGEALARCFDGFLQAHRSDGEVARLTLELARLVRTLHDSGHVHRDLYASHVFLDESNGQASLYLIDLARMFAPRLRRYRWYIKDLAQLKYSMPPTWVEAHWPTFLSEYLLGVGEEAIRRYDAKIDRKVASIRRHAERRKRGEEAARP